MPPVVGVPVGDVNRMGCDMGSRRAKTWMSAVAVAALTVSIGVIGQVAVEAAPGDDAFDVPGLVALNTNGDAVVDHVSCPSTGNCSAAGYFEDVDDGYGSYVVSQVDGVWGDALPIPGLAALNVEGNTEVAGLSCTSAGNCSAGGYYEDASFANQGFVVSQVDGVWGTAIPVPGLEALNTDGDAEVMALSCSAPGECVAVGDFDDLVAGDQAFVATQVEGVWGMATTVLGLSALNVGESAALDVVACASGGNCSAAGAYEDATFDSHGFVVSMVDGVWGTAAQIPGLSALDTEGQATVSSISCSAAGDCSIGGYYADIDGSQGFVASQVDDVWGTAVAVPGLKSLNVDGSAGVESVSCSSPGYCSAGGYYADAAGDQGFVVSQVDGVWGAAAVVPGLEALNTDGDAEVETVECISPGNCVAGGYYDVVDVGWFTFSSVQTEGTWGDAMRIPGTATLAGDENDAELHSISCTSDGTCVGGGYYTSAFDPDSLDQAYLFEFPIVPGGSLQPVLPARLVESRLGEKTVDGESEGFGQVDAESITRFVVAGRGGVPEGADAAMLNVTAVFPESAGFLTVWSCDGDVPVASSVNYAAGVVAPNAVLTALNDDGEACVYSLSATDLIVDVNGYVPIGGSPAAVLPARLVESRLGEETDDGESEGFGQVDAESITRFVVAGRGGVPEGADAAMLNVTAVFPESAGFLTVWSCDGDVPVASSVNYAAGVVAPNAVLTALNDDGEACVYSLSATDLIVDVNAAVDAGDLPVPVLPARLVESRPGEETVDGESEGFGQVDAESITRFVVAGRGGVPEGADAAMLNVTAVFPDAPGFLTVWSCDGDVPVASSVNYAAGDVAPNAVFTALNDDGEACVYSLSATDLIVDVNAYTD